MACKKTPATRRKICNLLSEQIAITLVVSHNHSCFLFVLYIIYALTYNCVTPSSSDVHFTILTSKTVLSNSLSPSTATKSPWFSSDSFVARVRDYQPLLNEVKPSAIEGSV